MKGNLCIIPARGGSKRIPGKNIRLFRGKPIIQYSIETAVSSGLFETVMVSTDDSKIASLSTQAGASVPFLRSSKNADDYATTIDVVNAVITRYMSEGKHYENICCLYPTAPLVVIEDLKKGLTKLLAGEGQVIMPVCPFSYPIWRGFRLRAGEKIEMVWPQYQQSRSQDLEQVFHDAGQWYWMSSNIGLERKPLYGPYSAAIVLEELFVQDIDNLQDWKIAELKYQLIHNEL